MIWERRWTLFFPARVNKWSMAVATSTRHSKAGLFSRSLLFYTGMAVATAIWGPIVLLSFPFPLRFRYQVSQIWSRFNIWWLKKTCRTDYRLSGLEYVPSVPVIVMAKHQSTWETLFLHQFLPPMAIVLKRELLWFPLFGWALALINPISIDRKTARIAIKQLLQQGQEHLDKGQWVLIFPEGTRIDPGQKKPYGIGGAYLAAHSGYPILPVAHNAGEYWPRRCFIKKPGTIQLVFGELIDSAGYTARELNVLTEAWIEDTMTRISQVPVAGSRNPATASDS